MYYGISQYAEVYNRIIRRASSPSSCQLVMFVSCLNVDATCATKMLSSVFKRQLIQTQIVPIFGYSELKSHYSKLDDTINTVLLIGLGGFIDVETFLEIDPQKFLVDEENQLYSRDIFVLDAHRPWNLDNLFGSSMIKCLDDGTVEETLAEQREAYLKLLALEEERENDSHDDESDESENESDERTDADDDDDEERVYINNSNKRTNEEGDNTLPPSRKKIIKQRNKDISHYENILEDYYSKGSTVVNSVASQIYSLLSSIGETNLQHLWLTILGATSLDTEYSSVYTRLFPILQDEVRRLSPNGGSGTIKTPDTLSLDLQPDYYLFLLRHSSLYNSFYYSNFVNAKLSLWNENGKKRLHKMFARMGIPLTTTQESWLYMDNNIKRDLRMIFDKNLDRYGLQDIIRDGFVKTFGYRDVISASEFVEALNALLEVGNTVPILSNEDKNSSSSSGSKEASPNNSIQDNSRKQWVSNFWLCWDALDDNKIELLKRGIEHAKFLQKSIFNTGVAILEKRLIKHLRIYRLCVLQDGPDLPLYQNPLTLLRLGNWLIECCSETEDKQLLPMVLASLNEQTDTYLVAGLSPRYPRGLNTLLAKKPILNNFSMAFQQIASQTGAQVKIDNFESSIIEISKEDLSPFLEKLTLSGLL